MGSEADEVTPELKQVLAAIEETGVHVVHVAAGAAGPAHSYTVGLWHSFEHPEVIAFGLPEAVAEELLEVVTDEVDDGKRFADGEKHEGLLVGYSVRFVAVPAPAVAPNLPLAARLYGADFPCLQLVWPDKEKRWPWQDGVRDVFRDAQPLLGSLPQ